RSGWTASRSGPATPTRPSPTPPNSSAWSATGSPRTAPSATPTARPPPDLRAPATAADSVLGPRQILRLRDRHRRPGPLPLQVLQPRLQAPVPQVAEQVLGEVPVDVLALLPDGLAFAAHPERGPVQARRHPVPRDPAEPAHGALDFAHAQRSPPAAPARKGTAPPGLTPARSREPGKWPTSATSDPYRSGPCPKIAPPMCPNGSGEDRNRSRIVGVSSACIYFVRISDALRPAAIQDTVEGGAHRRAARRPQGRIVLTVDHCGAVGCTTTVSHIERFRCPNPLNPPPDSGSSQK